MPSPLEHVAAPFGYEAPAGLTEAELHSELAAFSARFASVLGAMGERIAADGASPEVRRRALLLRVQLVPVVQQHALERDPKVGYVALLSLAVMLRQHVAENGQLEFGAHQAVVESAATSLEADLVALGRRFLREPQLAQLRVEIEELARTHKPEHGFAVVQAEDLLAGPERTRLFSIVDLPMAPFRALGGVEEGPAAIREFTQTARSFSAIVATLPLQLRWQVELLLEETAQREALRDTLDAIEQVAAGADRLSRAADRLPADLSESLRTAEGPLRELDETLRTARSLIEPLDAAAAEVARAGDAWTTLVRPEPARAGGERDAGRAEAGVPREAPGLAEWQRTASEVGRAAERLEAAATAIRELLDARGAEDEGLTRLDRLDTRVRSLVDHVLWRLVLLALILFALALAYRLASSHVAARR